MGAEQTFRTPRSTADCRADRPHWQFRIVAEIENFAALRRYVGAARSDLLAHDVSQRLASVLPEARTVVIARNQLELSLEGASFNELRTALNAIRGACALAFDLDGELHRVVLTLGAGAAPAGADDVLLTEEAEQALIEARSGNGAITHALDIAARQTDRLAAEIGRAIENDEMVLLYQPKIHVRRQEITSAEALIRWEHPVRGLILPGDFIPAAERAGVIGALTLWTLRRVIADQRTLTVAGCDLRLFVNISGQLLSDDRFVRDACALVADADVPIGFEVTETSVIRDPESAIANLQRFADIGIRIAIDDYGAGLSSLAYLKQLPARELKIDKLFITQLTSSNRDPLIVRSTIDLAHALEMEVVAEGVETHAALALLTVMGCDMVQGFLISRPIALDALITFLGEDQHHRTSQDTRASFTRLAGGWKRA